MEVFFSVVSLKNMYQNCFHDLDVIDWMTLERSL